MRRAFRAFLSVSAGLLVLAGVALAANTKSYPTQLGYAGPFGTGEFHGVMYGTLTSPKRACIPGRTVKLFLLRNGSLVLADTDTTSARGVWAAHAPDHLNGKVTVSGRRVGPRDHRILCRGSSLLLD